MTRPGDRLRKMASRVFGETTMERLIDPVLADLQTEHAQAIGRGSVWASRWIRLAGYGALLKVIAFCAWRRSMGAMSDRAGEQPIVGRTLGWSSAATAVAMFLLLLPIALRIGARLPAHRLTILVYLAPSQFSLALPIGVSLGILYGLRGVVISRRSQAMVLIVALVSSVASFANMTWALPAANQAYGAATGVPGTVVKGAVEMTLSELSARIDAERRDGLPVTARRLSFVFHLRWAISCAPLALAFFALSVVSRRRGGRFAFAVVAGALFLGYWLLLFAGRVFAEQDTLPAFAAAWLPNAAIVGASLGVLRLVPQRTPTQSACTPCRSA